MLKLFMYLTVFAFCIYIIGLVGEVIGAVFEVIFQLWWLIALLLAVVIALHLYFKGGFKKSRGTKANMPRNLDELVRREKGSIINTNLQLLDFTLSHELIDSLTTRITEVSGINKDGSSRQQILAQCKHGNPLGLYWHSHRGKNVCAVLSDYGLIGYLEADITANLYEKYVKDDTGELYTFTTFVEEITYGENGSSYGCIIAISIYKQRDPSLASVEKRRIEREKVITLKHLKTVQNGCANKNNAMEDAGAFFGSQNLVRSFHARIRGTTYPNDDGTSRQEILSRCLIGEPVSFYWHTFNGAPACAVISDHGQIGYLAADLAEDLDRDYGTDDYCLMAHISDITGGCGGYSYGCNILLAIYQTME